MLFDYLNWRGDLSFEAAPFNEVDNLIFSMLIYLDFSEIIQEGKSNPICSVQEKFFARKAMGKQLSCPILEESLCELLYRMGKSNRFSRVELTSFVDKRDYKKEMQFSAITYDLGKKCIYIAFRGTDDSLVAWKEDFNMCFMREVPAQKKALEYVQAQAVLYPDSSIFIGGHSKGGNLAVFSAVYADSALQKRILKVYNNDGPGFCYELLEEKEYKSIQDKIVTFVPQSSIVGMLLEHSDNYKIVHSAQRGLMQHNGFSWIVKGDHFVRMQQRTPESERTSLTIKNIMRALSVKQREYFISSLFRLLSSNKTDMLSDITGNLPFSLLTMRKAYNEMDEGTKKILSDCFTLFLNERQKTLSLKEENVADKIADFLSEKERREEEERLVKKFELQDKALNKKWKNYYIKKEKKKKAETLTLVETLPTAPKVLPLSDEKKSKNPILKS